MHGQSSGLLIFVTGYRNNTNDLFQGVAAARRQDDDIDSGIPCLDADHGLTFIIALITDSVLPVQLCQFCGIHFHQPP